LVQPAYNKTVTYTDGISSSLKPVVRVLAIVSYRYKAKQVAQLSQRDRATGWKAEDWDYAHKVDLQPL